MFITKLTTNGMTIWGSKMGEKLKQGYFKVNPFNPYVPLTELHYGYENDNVFQIRKQGGATVASYVAESGGMGKVLSAFNTEYFVFHNGATQIQCVSPTGTVKVLLNLIGVDDSILVTMDNNFVVVTFTGNTYTVKSYVIVGTSQDFWAELINTETIDNPPDSLSTSPSLHGCRANDTDLYVAIKAVTGGTFKTLKIVTNNGFSPSASLSWVAGGITAMPLPVSGTLVRRIHRWFYTPLYEFYVIKNDYTYSVYRKNGTSIWSGRIAGDVVDFVLDNETGNGYVVAAKRQDVMNHRFLVTLYSLQNGVLTQIGSASDGNSTIIPGLGGGFYPLIDNTIAPLSQGGRYAQDPGYKSVATTSSIAIQNAINIQSAFGSWVRLA